MSSSRTVRTCFIPSSCCFASSEVDSCGLVSRVPDYIRLTSLCDALPLVTNIVRCHPGCDSGQLVRRQQRWLPQLTFEVAVAVVGEAHRHPPPQMRRQAAAPARSQSAAHGPAHMRTCTAINALRKVVKLKGNEEVPTMKQHGDVLADSHKTGGEAGVPYRRPAPSYASGSCASRSWLSRISPESFSRRSSPWWRCMLMFCKDTSSEPAPAAASLIVYFKYRTRVRPAREL